MKSKHRQITRHLKPTARIVIDTVLGLVALAWFTTFIYIIIGLIE